MMINDWINVPQRKPPDAFPACQESVETQPVMYDRNFWQLGGANSETQWYCPPLVKVLATLKTRSIETYQVGAIELISAKLAMIKPYPNMTQI
jgi:hypothetical protein